jgi:hypothetical protein
MDFSIRAGGFIINKPPNFEFTSNISNKIGKSENTNLITRLGAPDSYSQACRRGRQATTTIVHGVLIIIHYC